MPIQKGDVDQCLDPAGGCAITMTKGALPGGEGDRPPTSCGGTTIVKNR
jgi:hypothetical protein